MEKYKKYLPNLILQADHDFPLHRSPICFGIPEKSLLPLLFKAMGAFPA